VRYSAKGAAVSDTGFAGEVGDAGPVAVAGGRTRWDVGGPLRDGARVIAAPTGVVRYTPDEMTVQVRAGTTVAELDSVLAEHGQRSALPDRGGTVGGALAVGENDVCALGRGRVRDALLQVRYVSAEGRIITGGGPTVKNVTGFDLPRVMVGSLGTLGLLAEVILRTNPRPAVACWLHSDDAEPRAVLDTALTPGAVLWDGTSTWVLLEGHGPDVDAQRDDLARIGSFEAVGGPPRLPPHRWSLPPADLFDLPGRVGPFVAALGFGLAFCHEPPPPRPLPPAVAAVHRRLKEQFDPSGRLNPGRDPGTR
jgi:FAD binding domain